MLVVKPAWLGLGLGLGLGLPLTVTQTTRAYAGLGVQGRRRADRWDARPHRCFPFRPQPSPVASSRQRDAAPSPAAHGVITT